MGVVVARKADLNWKLSISNSSLTIAGLWTYGDCRHVASGCTVLVKTKKFRRWTNYNLKQNNRRLHFARAVYSRHPLSADTRCGPSSNMTEDRATDIGNMPKNLVKIARVVPEISSRTDRQTYSSQYFATAPVGEVINKTPTNWNDVNEPKLILVR